MIYHYGSDIHLEHEVPAGLATFSSGTGDVLILAGDIYCPWEKSDIPNVLKTFQEWSKNYNKIVMVMGNHEHYHGIFEETASKIREQLSSIPNFTLLDDEFIVNGDDVIFGTTLWTDYNGGCLKTKVDVSAYMSDYVLIKTMENGMDSFNLTTSYIQSKNTKSRQKIIEFAEFCKQNNKRAIVVTHHWPVVYNKHKSDAHILPPDYAYYNTDTFELTSSLPENYVWICGHTHDRLEIPVYNGRLVTNCRGYIGHDPRARDYEFKEV